MSLQILLKRRQVKMLSTVLFVSILGYVASYPIHASCKLDWTFNVNCTHVKSQLVNQIQAWHDASNCPNGAGEKCLYTLSSETDVKMTLTHETPVHHYIDDVTFTFADGTSGSDSCAVHGYSTSETWYAVLDYSTNYCNMRNLLEGTGLHQTNGFMEKTSDRICTQYSSANCDKY